MYTDQANTGQCGLNGALYFVSMDADGGLSKYSGNEAGAKYGTGYCDSQCPRDLKFINGEVGSSHKALIFCLDLNQFANKSPPGQRGGLGAIHQRRECWRW